VLVKTVCEGGLELSDLDVELADHRHQRLDGANRLGDAVRRAQLRRTKRALDLAGPLLHPPLAATRTQGRGDLGA
jgi:hypothetical protein